jgi:hypothetical protein
MSFNTSGTSRSLPFRLPYINGLNFLICETVGSGQTESGSTGINWKGSFVPLSRRCSRRVEAARTGKKKQRIGSTLAARKLAHGSPLSSRSSKLASDFARPYGRPGKIGGYAAFTSPVSCIARYQCDSIERQSSFKTRVRTCSKRWAPRSVHRICCFLTIRLLTT